MPKSSSAGKLWSRRMTAELHRRAPLKHIVDLGAGIGTYASFRQAGQVWIAVEVWEPYIATYHLPTKYDRVIQQDIRHLDWNSLPAFDLVFCGDVLEHMTKGEALDVLNEALQHARVVLVSIPIVPSPQEAIHGNPFEVHVKDDWTHQECLSSFPNICAAHVDEHIGVYLLSRSEQDCAILKAYAAAMSTDAGPAAMVQHYRPALAANPGNVQLLTEFCFRCWSVAPDDVVATLTEICVRKDQTVDVKVYQTGLLVYFKEVQERRQRGLSLYHGETPEDLHFRFAENERLRWQRACMQLLKLKPQSYGGLLFMAQSLLACGDIGGAEEYFERARATGRREVASETQLGAAFHADLEQQALSAMGEVLPKTIHIVKGNPAARSVIFCACDYAYFRIYGRYLAKSFAAHVDDGAILAFHLYDLKENEYDEVAQQLHLMMQDRFALTTEWTGLREGNSQTARAYYHAIRFLRFFEVCTQRPKATAWLVDADLIFRHPLSRLDALIQGHDVALWFTPGRLEAHNQIVAAVVGIAPTLEGRLYLKRVAGYIAKYHRANALMWGIDQAALYAVYARTADAAGALKVTAIPPVIVDDGRLGGDTAIWPGKVDLESPVYPRFAAHLEELDATSG